MWCVGFKGLQSRAYVRGLSNDKYKANKALEAFGWGSYGRIT